MSLWRFLQGGTVRTAAFRWIVSVVMVATSILVIPMTASARQNVHHSAFINSGTVIVATPGDAADLDPASEVAAAANIMVVRNTSETLVDYANGVNIHKLVPLLATSWSSNKNKSVWTFHLRHGVRFHTGRCCMTAEDVRYSLARTVAAGLGGAYILGRFLTKPFQQIKVLNKYTVQFDLANPQVTFLSAIATKNVAQILDSVALKRHATKKDPYAHNWITSHDAGTGPYVLSQWQRGQQIVLTRFPQYWGGWSGRHFSKAIIRTVTESTTRRDLIERGDADVTFSLTPQDSKALKSNPAVRVEAIPSTLFTYIVMTEAGPLKSRAARQALSYAFDYNAMDKSAYGGLARRSAGPIPSSLLGYNPHLVPYHTDMAKSKALLAKAGVKPGTTLTYMYLAAYQAYQTAGLILQAQLAQLGLTVKLQGLDQATQGSIFFGNEPASKRPNLMSYGWWPDYNDPYDAAVPLVASWSAGAAGANAGYYHNAQVDALLKQMKTANKKTLVADARKLQVITDQVDPPAIWMAEPEEVNYVRSNLHGFEYDPLDLETYFFYPMYRG